MDLLEFLKNRNLSYEEMIAMKNVNIQKGNEGISIIQVDYPPTKENFWLSGICFDSKTKRILAKGVNPPMNLDESVDPKNISMVSLRMQDANIGSIVHVWYRDDFIECNNDVCMEKKGKWNVSTRSHTNATNVQWHNQNLGQKCLDSIDTDNLNKSYCYTIFIPDYLVQETTNVLHIGTTDMITMKDIIDHNIDLEQPKWMHNFRSWDELYKYVNELPISCPGVLMHNLETSLQYFMRNKKFDEIEKMLGNNRDIEYRCIVLNHLGKRQIAEQIFPILVPTFIEIEKILKQIAKVTYKCYVNRFILKKSKLIVHPEIHTIMQHMHKEYLERRRAGSYIKVTEIMVNGRIWIYSPRGIAKLIRLFRDPKINLLKVYNNFENDDIYKQTLVDFAKMSAKPERKTRNNKFKKKQ